MDSSYSACISVPHRTSFFFCSCSCEKLFWAWMQDSGFGICFRTAAWCCRELYILYRDNKYPVGENPFFPLKKELYQVMSSLLYITAQLKEVNFAVMFIARQLVHRSKPLKMQEEICLVCYSYLLFFFCLKKKVLKCWEYLSATCSAGPFCIDVVFGDMQHPGSAVVTCWELQLLAWAEQGLRTIPCPASPQPSLGQGLGALGCQASLTSPHLTMHSHNGLRCHTAVPHMKWPEPQKGLSILVKCAALWEGFKSGEERHTLNTMNTTIAKALDCTECPRTKRRERYRSCWAEKCQTQRLSWRKGMCRQRMAVWMAFPLSQEMERDRVSVCCCQHRLPAL